MDGSHEVGKPRILVVDDEAALRRSLQRGLGRRFDVVVASDGAAGLKALREEGPFAAILGDLQMPNMDGLTMLKQAAVIAPATVRLLFTGTLDAAAVMDSILVAGLFRVLYKPAAVADVLLALEEALNEHARIG
ncbi:MAG: response regulator [Polyangiaceae bacterium]